MKPASIRPKPFSILGIGSVPFEKGKNSCRKIFKNWDIPHWPQYPSLSPRENFVFQFVSTFPGLTVSQDRARFDESSFLAREGSYRRLLRSALRQGKLEAFEPPQDGARGWRQMKGILKARAFPKKRLVKLQITGPGTVWNSFFKDRIRRKYHGRAKKLLGQTLLAAGLAQIRAVQRAGKAAVIFVDEPAGPTDSSHLREMLESFKRAGAWTGFHVCSCPHWKGLAPETIGIFHFDASGTAPLGLKKISLIRRIVKRGGWVAWGIAPTFPNPRFKPTDFSEVLLKKIAKFCGRGLSQEVLLGRSLVAPACGTGTLKPAQDQAIFRSLQKTARSLKAKFQGSFSA